MYRTLANDHNNDDRDGDGLIGATFLWATRSGDSGWPPLQQQQQKQAIEA